MFYNFLPRCIKSYIICLTYTIYIHIILIPCIQIFLVSNIINTKLHIIIIIVVYKS